jgi:hypothetical protein
MLLIVTSRVHGRAVVFAWLLLAQVCRAALMSPIREFSQQHRAAAVALASPADAEGSCPREGGASWSEAKEDPAGKPRPLRLSDFDAALQKVGPTGAAARAFEQRASLRAREQARADQVFSGSSGSGPRPSSSPLSSSSNSNGGAGAGAEAGADEDVWANALSDLLPPSRAEAPAAGSAAGPRGERGHPARASQSADALSTLLESAVGAALLQAVATAQQQAGQRRGGEAGNEDAPAEAADLDRELGDLQADLD